MNSPSIGMKSIELRSNERLEHQILMRGGYSVTIIDNGKAPGAPLFPACHENRFAMGVTSITQQLKDNIFNALDVLLGLPTLSFRRTKTDEATPKVVLNSEVALTGKGFDELY